MEEVSHLPRRLITAVIGKDILYFYDKGSFPIILFRLRNCLCPRERLIIRKLGFEKRRGEVHSVI